MGFVMNESYEASVVTFLTANEWVGDSEAPYLASLLHIARLLDKNVAAGKALPAGLTMEFRMLFSELRKCEPARDELEDDFDEFVENV